MNREIEIGYLCDRGHYCFNADHDESGQCGSKRIARLVLIPEITDPAIGDVIAEADDHLADVIDTWRKA